jgi:cyclopropane fatty-acyl-phospholipid synthase-like methyltransferase
VALSDFFSRLRKPDPAADDAGASAANAQVTKALPKFLSGLSAKDQPALLDLGSVVGGNLNFFGEQLRCRITVEDLTKDIDRHVREDTVGALPEFLARRLPQPDASFDGIIGWDVFDYLEKPALQALATQVVRLLKPDGLMLAFFNNTEAQKPGPPAYTRYVVLDPRTLEHRAYPAARSKQKPVPNRDLQRLFAPLTITDQFLLKTNLREVIFRKPAAAATPPQQT